MNKLKIIGLGNFGKRTSFDFSRDEIETFFSIFPFFLNNFNLEKTSFFFEESHPLKALGSNEHTIDKEYSGIEHVENNQLDLDVVFLPKTIKVIIRHSPLMKNKIIDEIKKIATYSGFD